MEPKIHGCILMLKETGLEIYSKFIDTRLMNDPSLVAGLSLLVPTFASELRPTTREQLQSIVYQDITVLLEHGEFVTCALLTKKDTFDARTKQRRFLESFEKDFSTQLDGRVTAFSIADELFTEIFEG